MATWMLKLLLALFFISNIANAQEESSSYSSGGNEFLLGLSFFYTGDNFELSVDRKRTDTLIQGLLGYKYDFWIFGLTYDSDTEKQSFTSGASNQNVSWTRSAIGPTVGFTYNDLIFHLTYFINPTLSTVDDLNTTNTDYSKGSGFQLVAGYNYRIVNSFAIGLQIAYRSFQYDESQVGATTTSGTFRQAMVDPMLLAIIYM